MCRNVCVRQQRSREQSPNQHGQAMLLSLVLLFGVVISLAVVVWFGMAATRSAQAQAAADAAALAGATGGSGAARQLASANGAAIERLVRSSSEVEVLVEVEGQSAVARARIVAIAAVRRDGLAPAMIAALARAEQILGFELSIRSGFRSRADQQRLWDQRDANPYPVARPGTSMHERGLAVDIAIGQVSALAGIATDAGLCHPLPQNDPVHFHVCQIPE